MASSWFFILQLIISRCEARQGNIFKGAAPQNDLKNQSHTYLLLYISRLYPLHVRAGRNGRMLCLKHSLKIKDVTYVICSIPVHSIIIYSKPTNALR